MVEDVCPSAPFIDAMTYLILDESVLFALRAWESSF